MNVSDLYAEIGRLLGDPLNQKWTTDVLLKRINRAQIKVLAYTNAVKTKETLTATAANPEVQVDTDTMDIIRVDILRTDGNWEKLDGILRDQLDFKVPNWQQLDNGEPKAYWWDGTNQKLNLVPAPDSANAITSGLRVWEVQVTADLVNTTDQPFSSNTAMVPYHEAIGYWVVAECLLDQKTPESVSLSRTYRSGMLDKPGLFEQEIKLIHRKFDAPEDIPVGILWRPTGGRATSPAFDRKESPLG